jgi:ABC-type lipoprotein release transport system permease subunit
MNEAVARSVTARGLRTGPLLPAIAWRNLWRNRRRTWLTAGGIGFAVAIVSFAMAMQYGSYAAMRENATSLLAGHGQVQESRRVDEDRFEYTIPDATAVVRAIERVAGVASVAPRVEAFGLASVGERSFGAQVLGVDLAREMATVNLFDGFDRDAFAAGDRALVGAGLARNLGIAIGDELVVLGTGREGGMAAFAFTVAGIVSSGMSELDRTLVVAELTAVQSGFGLGDDVHTLAIRTTDLDESARIVRAIADVLPQGIVARNWNAVLPDLEQAIEIDRIGGQLFFAIILLLVGFSVVNTFIMSVFERTREFVMLIAIGMRAGRIQVLLQLESLALWALGAVLGLGVATFVILVLARTGIYLGEDLEAYAAQMHMPTRLYPQFSLTAFLGAPLVLLIGTQFAAFVPGLRIRRLRAAEALRSA